MSKLSNVVKTDVVKKTVYDKLVAKVDDIDTSDFVLKSDSITLAKHNKKRKFLMWVILLRKQTHWVRKQNSWY